MKFVFFIEEFKIIMIVVMVLDYVVCYVIEIVFKFLFLDFKVRDIVERRLE